jgi:hypothetical protein
MSIEDLFQIIRRKAKVVINKVTEHFIKESGWEIKKMEMEYKFMEVINFIKANGKMGISMAKDT